MGNGAAVQRKRVTKLQRLSIYDGGDHCGKVPFAREGTEEETTPLLETKKATHQTANFGGKVEEVGDETKG